MKSFTFHQKLMAMLAVHFFLFAYAIATEFSWWALLIGYAIAKISNMVGNECGLHRLWAHKSYKTTRFKEYILHLFAIPLLYGSTVTYAGIHRQHHKYSDTEKDPHITRPWWKTVFYVRNTKYDIETRFVSDLIKDPLHRWLHRNYFKINSLLLLSCLLVLGPAWTGWLLSCSVVYNFVGAGLVNVLGHRPEYGTRMFDSRDQSSNNRFVQIITWNEGLHNNHHANAGSYSFRVRPGDIDVPAWIIEKFLMTRR